MVNFFVCFFFLLHHFFLARIFTCSTVVLTSLSASHSCQEQIVHPLIIYFSFTDVGTITLTQYILLDPILLFFMMGAIYGSAKFQSYSHRYVLCPPLFYYINLSTFFYIHSHTYLGLDFFFLSKFLSLLRFELNHSGLRVRSLNHLVTEMGLVDINIKYLLSSEIIPTQKALSQA